MSHAWGPHGDNVRNLAVTDVLTGAPLLTAAATWHVRRADLARWVAATTAEQPTEQSPPTEPPSDPPDPPSSEPPPS